MEFHSAQPNSRPIVAETGHIRLKDPKTNVTYTGLLWSEVVERAPVYFSAKHRSVRNKEKYGNLVHAEFVKMRKERHEARPFSSQTFHVCCFSRF